MTQAIDPIKLKAAAEHLEWVLRQYPESEEVQSMLQGLLPLIEDAKSGKIKEPIERVPFGYRFSEGAFRPYKDPDVGHAYAVFATEMEGGLSDAGREIEAYIKAKKAAMQGGVAR